MQFVFAIVLCVCASEGIRTVLSQEIGEPCNTTTRERGTCMPQNACVERENASHHNEFEQCKLNSDGTPIICCVTKSLTTKRDQTSGSGRSNEITSSDGGFETKFYNPKKTYTKQVHKSTSATRSIFYDPDVTFNSNGYRKPSNSLGDYDSQPSSTYDTSNYYDQSNRQPEYNQPSTAGYGGSISKPDYSSNRYDQPAIAADGLASNHRQTGQSPTMSKGSETRYSNRNPSKGYNSQNSNGYYPESGDSSDGVFYPGASQGSSSNGFGTGDSTVYYPGNGGYQPSSGGNRPGGSSSSQGSYENRPSSGSNRPGGSSSSQGDYENRPSSGGNRPGGSSSSQGSYENRPSSGSNRPGGSSSSQGDYENRPSSGGNRPGGSSSSQGSYENRPSSGSNRPGGSSSSLGWPNQNRQTTRRPSVTEEPIWGTTERTTTRRTSTSGHRPPSPSYQQQKRISEQKCSDYSRLVTSTISAIPLAINGQATTHKSPDCQLQATSLVVGGSKAKLGEFPHMAALGFKSGSTITFNCGGTLISEEYVLTAAHCTHSSLGNPVVVRLGDLNLEQDDDGARPQTVNVASVTVHPNYKPPQIYHDIALIKLARKITFDKNLRPACLQVKREVHTQKVVATGWGSTNYGEISSDDLLKVGLDIIDSNQCNTLYGPDQKFPKGITSLIMCAGELSGKKDTCQGDSGGPLQVHDSENKCIYYVIGITSSGKSCGLQNSPGIYTRVSEYVSWIEGIVWRS